MLREVPAICVHDKVVDEADKMLKSSYFDWIPSVVERLSASKPADREPGGERLEECECLHFRCFFTRNAR